MSQKRPPRRLLACAALSAGVLLGSGAAAADTQRQPPPTARARLVALLDAALQVAATAPTTCERTDGVSLEPQCRMGNTKGPSYTDRAARAAVERARPVQARPVQARTPGRTRR